MEYVAGEEFLGYVTRVGPLPEGVLRGLLTPLLDGLSAVHGAGYLHRDIKPDNIVLRGSDVGSPVLLDFGAARLAMGAHSRRLTVVLTPGYAPIEQYSEASEQGPYTDVYALGAVLYYGLTGEAPQEATDRMLDDRLPSRLAQLAGSGGISRDFLVGLEAALQVDPRNRPASLAAWRRQLDPEGKLPESALRANSRPEVAESKAGASDSEKTSAAGGQPQDGGSEPLQQSSKKHRGLLAVGGVALLICLVGFVVWLSVGTGEISRLLVAAEADMAAGRLTSPEGNNAWEKYQQVLAVSPAYEAALARIDGVMGEYWARFEQALTREEFDKARVYLQRVEELHTDSPRVVEGGRCLEAALERLAELERRIDEVVVQLASEMVSIPGGTFRMGDLSDEGYDDEKPVHGVTVPAFNLGKYEVTFALGRMLAWRTGDAAVTARMMRVGVGAGGRSSTFPGMMYGYFWIG